MNREQIARVTYEANRAYCFAIGDPIFPPWEDAAEWQRETNRQGVKFHLDHPTAEADHSHAEWMKEKLAHGWSHGVVKDENKKLHPCMVPFDELPAAQKAKDFIFRAIVHALASHVTEN